MKHFSTRQVEKAVHPFDLVELEGMPLQWSEDGKTAFTECPFCKTQSLWVRNDGFVCVNLRCGWLSGSVLELATIRNGSLKQAISKFRYYFPARTEHWAPQFLPELEESYRVRRRLIELLGESNLRRDEDPMAPSWHEAFQLSWDLSRKMVFQMRSAQIEEWFQVCKEGYGLKKTAPGKQGLIIPFFVSPFELSGFVFLDPASKQRHWFQLQDYAWAWAGWLALVPPANAPVMVTQSVREALSARANRELPAVIYHYRPFGLLTGKLPSEKLVLPLDVAKPTLTAASRLAPKCDLRIEVSDTRGRSLETSWITWPTFIREGVRQRLTNSGELNDDVVAFLQRCRPSVEVLEEVRDWFLDQHRADIASQLEAEVLDIPICSSKDGEILQRGGKYVFVDHRSGWISDVSNFVASPEGIVTFPLSKQVFYSLRVELEGVVKEVLCPQADLLSAPQLEPRLISAFSMLDGASAHTLPRIENRTHIRTIAEHLITACAKKGERQGVDYCGWSYDKSVFRTPWWMISAERGLVEDEFPLHPELDSACIYSSSTFVSPGPAVELPQAVRSMLRILIALLARSWRGTGLQQIRVADSPWSRELLSVLMGTFGQVRPFAGLPTAEKYARTCPSYGTDLEQNSPVYSKMPLIDLAEIGLFEGEASRIPEGLGGMCLSGVRRVVEACIAESPFPLPEKQFVPIHALLEEGRAWEKSLWGTKAKPILLFPETEKLFSELPLETIKGGATMERESRTLTFQQDLISSSNVDELAVEMATLCPGTEVLDDGKLQVPVLKFQKMIYDWYGEVPRWSSKAS